MHQGLTRALTEADHPLLAPLGVLDQNPLGGEVHVRQLKISELAGPEACVEEGLVASAFPRASVAVAEEAQKLVDVSGPESRGSPLFA